MLGCSTLLVLGLALAPEAPSAGPSVAEPVAAEPAIQAAVQLEACDGSRRAATASPDALACERWTLAWREGGTVWGLIVAPGHEQLVKERERQLAFARKYARLFSQPFDERYADPGPPVCSTCTSKPPPGRWGEGQKFGDAEARRAVADGRAALQRLDEVLEQHLPHLENVARLAREPRTAKAAKSYAKQLRQAVFDLARGRLALDDAALFRSPREAQEVIDTVKRRVEALGSGLDSLEIAVAREVARTHGGKYVEDGGAKQPAGPAPAEKGPWLEVAFDGAKVSGIYHAGAATSTWFEGKVALDGAISGRSLVAPEKGTLTCNEHTEACGFVYVPSVLRFNVRPGSAPPTDSDENAKGDGPSAGGSTPAREVAELWFRQSQWIQAKPFSRPAR